MMTSGPESVELGFRARALWVAVLVQAVRDLKKPAERDGARHWLTKDRECAQVCEFAGVSHKGLVRGLKKAGLLP